MSSPARCRGVTLVELIVTIVVVAAAACTVLAIVSSTAANSANNLIQTQAIIVAESYLNEILQKPFGFDCAPICTRLGMDKVADYNGLNDVGVHDQSGSPVSGLTGYTVQVAVTNSPLGAPAVPAAESELVTVTVTPPSGAPVVLNGYRTLYP